MFLRSPVERHLLAAERRLAGSLELRPVPLPPRMMQAVGLWKDAPATITTRAWEGNAVDCLRVAMVSGVQLSIGILFLVPRANRSLPILGAEMVSLGPGAETTICADLSPARSGAGREADERAIAAVCPDVGAHPPGGEHPAWCARWLSRSALCTRVGADRLDAALALFDRYVEGWIALEAVAVPDPDGSDEMRVQHEAYAAARRTEDATLDLLATMFGRAWADEYVASALFPQHARRPDDAR